MSVHKDTIARQSPSNLHAERFMTRHINRGKS